MVKIEGKRKVHIIKMVGEPQYNGREGYATYIDDMGQIHGTWGGLALQPNFKNYRIVKEKEPVKFLLEDEGTEPDQDLVSLVADRYFQRLGKCRKK